MPPCIEMAGTVCMRVSMLRKDGVGQFFGE